MTHTKLDHSSWRGEMKREVPFRLTVGWAGRLTINHRCGDAVPQDEEKGTSNGTVYHQLRLRDFTRAYEDVASAARRSKLQLVRIPSQARVCVERAHKERKPTLDMGEGIHKVA